MKTPCGMTLHDIEPKAREFIKLVAGIDVGRLHSHRIHQDACMTFEFDPRQAGGDFNELNRTLTENIGYSYMLVASNWLGTECAWDLFGGRRISLLHKHGSPDRAAIELSWTPRN